MKNPFLKFDILDQLSDQVSYRVIPEGMHYWWVETNEYTAAITLCGGQLVWFEHKNHKAPAIFLSDKSHLNDKKSLRGGTPICWPWFNKHPSRDDVPNHGLVRSIHWQLLSHQCDNGVVELTLSPVIDQAYKNYVPEGVTVTQTLTFSDSVEIELVSENKSKQNFEFSAALHTYFNVGDIRETEVRGLAQSQYIALKNDWQPEDTPKVYKFREETDRIHLDKPELVRIYSPVQNYELYQSGHNSVVVWNPWQALAQNTPGLEGDCWQEMLCIEPGAIKPTLVLKPNQSHALVQKIVVSN
ncbi:hypothetical protein C2869_15165 [Saccharobesus litoralis]|uniref:Putative glucose-6-phosphate 1-epimerase n=1 Tax=Saccharobesus litoralis TaxID=2172099 RepID=A0A2S0VU11_9ALTE|nr:D-hexose-6-phosphate mutarotase [Saccharobesus litoralis]AWB67695.1 hypothetical protein C2869_15165 [Saccharobesus litoralis]